MLSSKLKHHSVSGLLPYRDVSLMKTKHDSQYIMIINIKQYIISIYVYAIVYQNLIN